MNWERKKALSDQGERILTGKRSIPTERRKHDKGEEAAGRTEVSQPPKKKKKKQQNDSETNH